MRNSARLLTALLALLALGQVQVFGWVKSYWCPCNPQIPSVLTSRCDSAVCHPHSHRADSPDHSSEDLPGKSQNQNHGHLALSDGSSATPPNSETDRLVTPLLAWAWEVQPKELSAALHRWELPPRPPPESPPISLLGIRSTVILV
jgi:hypothetical protein